MPMQMEPLGEPYRESVDQYVRDEWGGPMMVTRGRVTDTRESDGFVATEGGALLGAALYAMRGDSCEITALFSLAPGRGVGSALLGAVKDMAGAARCRRVWLVTTNDNLSAIRFYQRRGWNLAAVYLNALGEARRLKPSIPMVGEDGIPLLHEFEFEWVL